MPDHPNRSQVRQMPGVLLVDEIGYIFDFLLVIVPVRSNAGVRSTGLPVLAQS